jgi:hypothetical protein
MVFIIRKAGDCVGSIIRESRADKHSCSRAGLSIGSDIHDLTMKEDGKGGGF